MSKINLEDKSPQELERLLEMAKTSSLDYEEKRNIIERIRDKLGVVSRDPRREKAILADIQSGSADIDDIN